MEHPRQFYSALFEEAWRNYPKRRGVTRGGKLAAWRRWKEQSTRLGGEQLLFEAVKAAVIKWINAPTFDDQFVPDMARYLYEGRYEE